MNKSSIGIGLVIFAIVSMAGCLGNSAQPAEEVAPAVETPTVENTAPTQPVAAPETVITSFSGDSKTKTQQFTVPAKWKVEWETKGTDQYEIFSIYLIDDQGKVTDFVANSDGTDKGETYMYEAGTYAFDISTTMPYEIKVKTA
jgi:PBP1b-binding outer membrane lipoprotein LpoB